PAVRRQPAWDAIVLRGVLGRDRGIVVDSGPGVINARRKGDGLYTTRIGEAPHSADRDTIMHPRLGDLRFIARRPIRAQGRALAEKVERAQIEMIMAVTERILMNGQITLVGRIEGVPENGAEAPDVARLPVDRHDGDRPLFFTERPKNLTDLLRMRGL